jgi:2-oxoglutarate ferredoxin oxidoreductase subunit alpha
VKIAIEHMTPVLVLSDGYIANGAEPWKFPKSADLKDINVKKIKSKESEEKFMPYLRDENLVRQWVVPGTEGFEHRIGGLEKEENTGNISYDPENHQKMVLTREEKIERIADFIPEQSIDSGKDEGKVLVLGWGSTFGSIKSAVIELIEEGIEVSHAHITYIKPFPKNLEKLMNKFDKVLIPEINNGQLIKLIRDKYLVDAVGFNKIKGTPITKSEMKEEILKIYPKV